ncbi:MAG: metallophosphoesterase, partial [Sedimentisphaerales bacterium]|nr:metallophosphoesterase [Sedimentisphaerales bacterium]
MKGRLHNLSIIVIAALFGFRAFGSGVQLSIEPLWSVGIIADTQTWDRDCIEGLLGRLKAEHPNMVIHLGDTNFEWSNQFVLKAVADLVDGENGPIEFHLAPGNHDMRGGSLKEGLRQAATQGVFRLDKGPTFAGRGYLHSGVAAYVPDPLMPVWNPEIVNHPAWQTDLNVRFAVLGGQSEHLRYVFKRGGIRFIVCDWSYSDEQREWLRDIITRPDDSSVSIVLHHEHKIDKLSRYFEGLDGRHNVKLVLSGHDHRYYHEKQGAITYITSAGIARSERGCDGMILRVYRNYLRLDRYVLDKGATAGLVLGPEPIWMCTGNFGQYHRPELPRRAPAYVRSTDLGPGV